MLLTIQLAHNNRIELMPVIAPRGAAAYYVSNDPKSNNASVIFAMMKKGESGLDTLNRTLTDRQGMSEAWLPVASRPEAQRAASYTGPDFVSYDFVYNNEQWNTATLELANFLKAMQSFQALPALPPRELAFDVSRFAKTGKSGKRMS
jgi:hypothetical protein